MRATWTAAVLTAALGLTTVTAASVNVASAADAAPAAAVTVSRPINALHSVPATHSVPVTHPVTAAVPADGLPAAPDPTKALDVLGALGGVLKIVTGLVSSVLPASGTPDPAALQKLLTDLQSAVTDLLGKLPGLPPLPVASSSAPGTSSVPTVPSASPLPIPLGGSRTPAELPVPVPAPLPASPLPAQLPASPADALAKVQKDATDLVAAATATKPDPAAVKNLVGPLSADSVSATTATATTLVTS